MADEPESPSRALGFGARAAGFVFYLLLASWLMLLAALALLHGWVVPHIGDFLPRVEAGLSRALDMPVRVGAVSARSDGLLPSFELRDVAAGPPGDASALLVPKVALTLSPRSILAGRFAQIHLQGAHAQLRRTRDGHIQIAGMTIDPNAAPGSGAAADWLFSQPEIMLRQTRLEWLDEQRGLPAVALTDVDVVLRNAPWRHAVRIDATPPPAWGERISIAGRFRQRVLFARHNGHLADWSGTLYGRWGAFDAEALAAYLPALPGGTDMLDAASGGAQAWVDVRRGAVVGGTVDLALKHLAVRSTGRAPPSSFGVRDLVGRLTASRDEAGFHVAARQLGFSTDDGSVKWPVSDADWWHGFAAADRLAHTTVQATRLDLGILSRMAAHMSFLPAATRAELAQRNPRGLLHDLQLSWNGPADDAVDYRAQGRAEGLEIAAVASPSGASGEPGVAAGAPGVAGLGGRFDVKPDGGSADIAIDNGRLEFPGVFEEPAIEITRLRAGVRWQRRGEDVSVDAQTVVFANTDLAGEASIHWQSAAPVPAGASPAPHGSPGVLDLTGALIRADGTRVWRYLPLHLGNGARHYVRDAVRAGVSVGTQFTVRGDLRHLPFIDPALGEFRIASQIRGATLAFAPPSVQNAGEKPWPQLTRLSGELVFERNGMEVRDATARLGMPGTAQGGIQVTQVSAGIQDFSHTDVKVQAEAQGPLQEMLEVVEASPLAKLTDHALDAVRTTGPARLSLKLGLPAHAMSHSTVQGSLTLAGNELRLDGAALPPLQRAQGTVAFTESGFTVPGVEAEFLGGNLRVEAGSAPAAGGGASARAPVVFHLQGTTDMAALRQVPELDYLSPALRHLGGSTAYEATIALADGMPDLTVTSSLQGLAIDLPPPFAKAAADKLPLRFEHKRSIVAAVGNSNAPKTETPAHDEIDFSLGNIASLRYERELAKRDGSPARVLRGSIAIGQDATKDPPQPQSGVAANVQVATIDVDRWRSLLEAAVPAAASGVAPNNAAAPVTEVNFLRPYLPATAALRADLLIAGWRSLHDLVAAGSQTGTTWRATLAARELDGYVEYRERSVGAPAKLFARLARLQVPEAAASDVDQLAQAPEAEHGDESSAPPALDIVVDSLQLKGRDLGRVQVLATNRAAPRASAGERIWELEKLDLRVPEAHLSATGRWAREPGSADAVTAMDFRLDISDSGALLARFGMPGLIRHSPGNLQGSASWQGSPLDPDFTTMNGQLELDMASGQFLKADPGIAKLLGVLSLQSLPRRLTLDFRDVFSDGFAFDFVRGKIGLTDGIARTDNLKMKGVAAAVLMEGKADLVHETQDLHVVVIPEINAGTASLVATAINPVVGVASFIAQIFLRGPLIRAATREFRITGSWTDPEVKKLTGDDRLGKPAESH